MSHDLSGLSHDEAQELFEATPHGPTPYAPHPHAVIERDHMPGIDVINQRFAQILRGSLVNIFKQQVSVSACAVEKRRFQSVLDALPNPAYMAVLKFDSFASNALLVMPNDLADWAIESLFGGLANGQTAVAIERARLSVIEQSILADVVKSLTHDLQNAWRIVVDLTIDIVRKETEPLQAKIANNSDWLAVTTTKVQLHDKESQIYVCYPYQLLQPMRATLNNSHRQHGQISQNQKLWSALLRQHVDNIQVDVRIPWSEKTVRLEQITRLKVGDTVTLPPLATLTAQVEDCPLFTLRDISNDERRCVEVIHKL